MRLMIMTLLVTFPLSLGLTIAGAAMDRKTLIIDKEAGQMVNPKYTLIVRPFGVGVRRQLKMVQNLYMY